MRKELDSIDFLALLGCLEVKDLVGIELYEYRNNCQSFEVAVQGFKFVGWIVREA